MPSTEITSYKPTSQDYPRRGSRMASGLPTIQRRQQFAYKGQVTGRRTMQVGFGTDDYETNLCETGGDFHFCGQASLFAWTDEPSRWHRVSNVTPRAER